MDVAPLSFVSREKACAARVVFVTIKRLNQDEKREGNHANARCERGATPTVKKNLDISARATNDL